MSQFDSNREVYDLVATNNLDGILIEQTTYSASGSSQDFTLENGQQLALFLDVTSVSGTSPTLDIDVEAKDPASGKYFTLKSFTQITGATSEALFIGTGADTVFPTRQYRLNFTTGGTTPSFTLTVGYAVTG